MHMELNFTIYRYNTLVKNNILNYGLKSKFTISM